MERYIKVQAALDIIDKYAKTVEENEKVVVDAVRDIVEIITPATDVVPKSEVERLEKELAEALISEYTDIEVSMGRLYRVRKEHPIYKAIEAKVAREIFEEVDSLLDLVCHMIGIEILSFPQYTELKKKYTEGKE